MGSDLWYYIFPIIVLIVGFLGYKKPSIGKILLYVLLFFSMFRGDNVGNDTKGYMDSSRIEYKNSRISGGIDYEYAVDNIGQETEYGDALLNSIVYRLNLSGRVIIFSYSLLTFIFLFAALKRLKINVALALVFYVFNTHYFFSLSAARQMAAVSIFLYGVTFLFCNDKRKFLFFFFTILATMFHTSAIFYIWIFLLRYVKCSRKLLIIISSAAVLVTVFFSFNILDLVYNTFDLEYVSNYMGRFDESERGIKGRIFDVLRFAFILYALIARTKTNNADTYDVVYCLAIVLMALFTHSNILISRITFYITPFMCLFWSKIIIENRCLKNVTFVALLALYLFLAEYEMGIWSSALRSGYYLMF